MKSEEISKRVKASRARGRSGEYRIAKLLHGVRCGNSKIVKLPSGRMVELGNLKPDVLTELFAVESKYRKDCPQALIDYMGQAISNTPDGFISLAVIKAGHDRYFYCMLEKDFIDLHVGYDRQDDEPIRGRMA